MRTFAAKPLLRVIFSVIGIVVLLMFVLFPCVTLVLLLLISVIIALSLVHSDHICSSFCKVKTSVQKLE